MVKKKDPAGSSTKTLSKCKVFFDFDNTITRYDILDDIIQRFSVNDDWIQLEEDWKTGKIGSRECLEGQLKGVRVKKAKFVKYLSTIKIDPGFHKLIDILKKKKVGFVIVSDSFSFVIKSILANNGIHNIRIYSNRLRFSKDRLIPLFPHFNKNCPRCANCKTSHLFTEGENDNMVMYVGDGRSDICPALHSNIVFAKGSLLKHFRNEKKDCIEFRELGDVVKNLNT